MLTYGYDADSQQTLRQDSFGGVLTDVYDAVGNQTSIQFGGVGQTPLRLDQSFTADNQLAAQNRYSNLTGTAIVGTSLYAYDAAGNETSIQDKNSTGGMISNTTYAYDPADRLTTTQVNGGTPVTYTYDSVNELTNDGTQAYTYDLAGNRTMAGYTLGPDNELSDAGAWAYTYDANGNLLSAVESPSNNIATYSYNGQNQLTSVIDSSPTATLSAVTYTYDVMGNRIEEDDWTSTGGASTTKFAYDGADVFADLSSSNTLQTRRLYATGVDQLFARVSSGGTAAWYLTRLRRLRSRHGQRGGHAAGDDQLRRLRQRVVEQQQQLYRSLSLHRRTVQQHHGLAI